MNHLAARYAKALNQADAAQFAEQLGVSVDSLRDAGAGFDGFRLCFFERNASRTVTAINVRFPDGAKRVGRGQQRGLIIPETLEALPDPVLVVEGPSDVCACLTMELTAVGRPNNAGGGELLAELLRGREVLVAGEHDTKPSGLWPGRDGAKHVATQLARAWRRGVYWTLPPPGAKDVRAFLLSHKDEEPKGVGKELLALLRASATITHPNPKARRVILARKAVRCG